MECGIENQTHAYGAVVVFADKKANKWHNRWVQARDNPAAHARCKIPLHSKGMAGRRVIRGAPATPRQPPCLHPAWMGRCGQHPNAKSGGNALNQWIQTKIWRAHHLSGTRSTKRYILEYSDQVSAILQWREDLGMIVMDHLSPPSSDLEGQTSFYGPDMSYDGFIWKKNHWVLQEDVDVRDPDLQALGTTPNGCVGGTGISGHDPVCAGSVDETHSNHPLIAGTLMALL